MRNQSRTCASLEGGGRGVIEDHKVLRLPACHGPQLGGEPVVEVAADVGDALAVLSSPLICGDPLDCNDKIVIPRLFSVGCARPRVSSFDLSPDQFRPVDGIWPDVYGIALEVSFSRATSTTSETGQCWQWPSCLDPAQCPVLVDRCAHIPWHNEVAMPVLLCPVVKHSVTTGIGLR